MNTAWMGRLSTGIWLVALLAALLLGALYLYNPRPALAMVDAITIVQEARALAVQQAVRTPREEDQGAHAAHLEQFGERLNHVIEKVAAERGVVLLQKQAILAGQLPDLTDEVRQRLRNAP